MRSIAKEIVVWRSLFFENLGHIRVTEAFSERRTNQNPQVAIILDTLSQLLQFNGPVFLIKLPIALVDRSPEPG